MEKEYWDNRWVNKELGWDIGKVSKPLKEYFDTLEDKSIKILIPGAGNGYEAEYLHNKGFTNVFVADISEHALQSFMERCPGFPKEHTINKDFFKLEEKYDLIIEQTFFCSMYPSRRIDYAQKMKSLLKKDGKLVGVLFDRSFDAGPPFGGCKEDYMKVFGVVFDHVDMVPCKNSIKERMGTELWFEAKN
ncbi:MAG: methyltransferase domain-containing protein [Crocinitomicaceae bacterium]|nr:methyltransferase domain-containing protein [Crocinitomicaceae bacterium]